MRAPNSPSCRAAGAQIDFRRGRRRAVRAVARTFPRRRRKSPLCDALETPAGRTLQSSGRVFNDWLVRARADIALLTTDLETGPYPYAGIPWFSTAFGRDGVISALQMLWLDPGLARGVLTFLARHQATETAPFSDSEPGKIMHETRKGEMAALRELPFGRYYGGVDTTPLYIYLATAYAQRMGDTRIHRRSLALAACGHRLDRSRLPRGRPTGSSLISGRPAPACQTRAGRTATIPSSMPTAVFRPGRSPSSRFKVMSSPPSGHGRLASQRGEEELAAGWSERPRRCEPRSKPASGWRMRDAMHYDRR